MVFLSAPGRGGSAIVGDGLERRKEPAGHAFEVRSHWPDGLRQSKRIDRSPRSELETSPLNKAEEEENRNGILYDDHVVGEFPLSETAPVIDRWRNVRHMDNGAWEPTGWTGTTAAIFDIARHQLLIRLAQQPSCVNECRVGELEFPSNRGPNRTGYRRRSTVLHWPIYVAVGIEDESNIASKVHACSVPGQSNHYPRMVA